MFWLSRPPYARWVIASLVLAVGLVVELRGDPTVPHPFATEPIPVGETVDESKVRWKEVPAGLLHPVSLPAIATRSVLPGEPVPQFADTTGVPEGWWAVEVTLPTGVRSGMTARLVTPGTTTEGIVVTTRQGDFGEQRGLVAVPEPSADEIAMAALDATLVVMIGG